MDKLEKAARECAKITPDVSKPYTLNNLNSYRAKESYKKYSYFKKGAEWQMNNIWISVEEELPENIGEDYGFSEDVIISNHAFCVGYYDYRTKKWMCSIMENLEIENVTHWMPIPKLNK